MYSQKIKGLGILIILSKWHPQQIAYLVWVAILTSWILKYIWNRLICYNDFWFFI